MTQTQDGKSEKPRYTLYLSFLKIAEFSEYIALRHVNKARAFRLNKLLAFRMGNKVAFGIFFPRSNKKGIENRRRYFAFNSCHLSTSMKLLFLAALFSCVVALAAAQWSQTDHEVSVSQTSHLEDLVFKIPYFLYFLQIFDIQAALEKDEGPGTNFYSIMNLTKGASATEIRKAYRARSMELQ